MTSPHVQPLPNGWLAILTWPVSHCYVAALHTSTVMHPHGTTSAISLIMPTSFQVIYLFQFYPTTNQTKIHSLWIPWSLKRRRLWPD
ncbi:hypothetical protein Hanom_Chr15g01404661 [Helianthus anomalus]